MNKIKQFFIKLFGLDELQRLKEFLDTMPHEEKQVCEEVLRSINRLED